MAYINGSFVANGQYTDIPSYKVYDEVDVTKYLRQGEYSESYFGYAFKQKYKISVSQYIRELKLAKSKELLKNTSFSVAGVASSVGFDTPNYFSSLFKSHFGISPKEYRKTHSQIVK